MFNFALYVVITTLLSWLLVRVYQFGKRVGQHEVAVWLIKTAETMDRNGKMNRGHIPSTLAHLATKGMRDAGFSAFLKY
jgi:hypothetical protein